MSGLLTLTLIVAAALGMAWWIERRRRLGAEEVHHRELAEQRAERMVELRAQTERTVALFDRMVEGLIVVDATARIRVANRAAKDLLGIAAPATGSTLLEATRHHEIAAIVTRLANEPEILGHELRLEGIGPSRFLQVNALALRDSSGVSDGAILVFHDLTRLRELEAVRQEFVANVSHELRTPLSLIKSAAETLIDGGKNDLDALTRFLAIIDKNANRLTLLIDDLLMLSTLDSGNMRLSLQPVSLRAAAQEVMDDLKGRLNGRPAKLENAIDPGMVAQVDPDRLRQVLFNLIGNALKYGRLDGHVTASARVLDGRRVRIAIRDDGPGIPAEARARIFERFYRVDKARSRQQGGTGLGLAIVKNVVQAHGGEVGVESKLGEGAEFYFTLPRSESN